VKWPPAWELVCQLLVESKICTGGCEDKESPLLGAVVRKRLMKTL
jgi:hypothetical protein